MSAGNLKLKNVLDYDEELLRPVLRGSSKSSGGMGASTRHLRSKLNRGVRFSEKKKTRVIKNQSGWSHGNVFDYQKRYSQRVVVKSHVVVHKGTASNAATMKSHTYYLARDGAGVDGEKAEFYNEIEEGLSAQEFVEKSVDDPHHFRVIISPENGADIKDMHDYVRKTMAGIEDEIGRDIDWVAVNHFNTDNPHAHVIIRGRDKAGKDLRISREVISHGMRHHAEKTATQFLGGRSLSEIKEAQKREVSANRVTGLDHKIEKLMNSDRVIDVRLGNKHGYNLFEESLVRGRLAHLHAMGLAEKRDVGVFVVDEKYKETLYGMSTHNDVIKQMYKRVGNEASRMIYHDLRKAEEGQKIIGVVIDKGQVDELKDRYYVVLRDHLGRSNYINIGNNRNFEDITKGGVIKVGQAQASTSKADANIAAIAKANGGIYDVSYHYEHAHAKMTFLSFTERNAYVDRHVVRLESLEKSGLVERLGHGHYKVAPDLVEKGRELTEEMNANLKKYGIAQVDVLMHKSLESQVKAKAWTVLDETLESYAKDGQSYKTGWREIDAALDARAAKLIDKGHAYRKDGIVHIREGVQASFEKAEKQNALKQLGEIHNRKPRSIDNVKEINGEYKGSVTLHSGKHAVVTTRGTVSLVPHSGRLNFKRGQELSISLGKSGRYSFIERELGLSL